MRPGVNAALVGCTLLGISVALLQALTMPCIADACNPGLYAGEVLKYGSWQYYLPVNDPYLLDYTLNIAASLLFGLYNTQTLFLVSFLFYAGCVAAAGLLVRQMAGDTAGLAAAALVANVPNACIQQLIYPVWHGSTVFLILVALNIYVSKTRSIIKYPLLGVVTLFTVYSDTIALPMLVLPIIIISLYNTTIRRTNDYLSGLTCFTAGITGYLLKSSGGQMWSDGPYLVNVGGLDRVISLVPDPVGVFDYLLNLMLKAGGPIMFLLLLVGIAYSISHKSKFLAGFLALSSVFMLAGFTLLDAGGDLGRYLYPLVVFAMLPIATIRMDKKLFGLVPIVLLIVCAGLADNIVHVTLDNHDPNQKDRQLIAWLRENNISSGAADYWPANLIRLMSNDQIRFAPAYVANGELCYLTLNTAQRWDQDWPPTTLFTYGENDPVYNYALSLNITPTETLTYYGYHTPATKEKNVNITIFRYNMALPVKIIDDPKSFEDAGFKPV